MKIKEIVNALEMFAPLPLQDGFDNAGLQIGLTDAEATGALLCLDVTEAVVDEAVTLGYNLIVSHHPLIFKGYKSITGKDYVERCIMKAIKNDITIFSMHTNLDNAPQGVNYKIAEKIGLQNIRILDPKENALLKLVTFVPAKMAGIVRQALFEAGCGCIGNYDACSYNVEGEGTFRAQEGTHPYCGKIGELHKEPETRIETILPAYLRSAVTKALLAVHPYEEPAYDFYPLANTWNQVGSGIIGELKEPETETDFLKRYLRRGLLPDHIKRICRSYKAQLDAMLSELSTFPEGTTYTRPDGGLFIFVTLPEGIDAKELLEQAVERHVAYVPGTHFFCDGRHENTLRLNFSNSSIAQIHEGMSTLREIFAQALAK